MAFVAYRDTALRKSSRATWKYFGVILIGTMIIINCNTALSDEIPRQFQGKWSNSPKSCSEDPSQGILILNVEPASLEFYEIDCSISVLRKVDGGVAMKGLCTKGGSPLQESGLLRLTTSGPNSISLSNSGYSSMVDHIDQYYRCQVSGATANDVLWNHNGSTVSLSFHGDHAQIVYITPRPGMVAAGAKSGDILFLGSVNGGRITGEAFLFSRKCGKVAYPVAGEGNASDQQIILRGQAPKLSATCLVTSRVPDLLAFDRIDSTSPAPAVAALTPPSGSQGQLAPPPPSSPRKISYASGTGFFVAMDGAVLTNAHVVDGCSSVSVGQPGGFIPVKIIAKDTTNDLALISSNLTPSLVAHFRPSIRLGEQVAAFGYPLSDLLASSGNFTAGYVTATAGLDDDTRYIQISAPIQPGNSGGPLVDISGNLVGVVSAKLNAARVMADSENHDIAQNVNFAIKSSVAQTFLEGNEVKVQIGTPGTALQSADLAELTKALSVFILCKIEK